MTTMKTAAMRESRDIEWLVNWALEKQGLGQDLTGRRPGQSGSGSTLGTKVDGGGSGNDGRWVHEDAETIAVQIGKMARDAGSAEATALLVHYGQTATRPDWGSDGSGRWQLVRRNDGDGPAKRRYADPRHSRGLLGFEWEWVGWRPDDLDRMMLEWLAWRAALVDLRLSINANLRHYLATGPAAPEAPWDDAHRTITLPEGRVVRVHR